MQMIVNPEIDRSAVGEENVKDTSMDVGGPGGEVEGITVGGREGD